MTTSPHSKSAVRRPTIIDVARAAGVSVSTVSRVVRDHADVGAGTRNTVREAIDRLGYRPSPIARALVSGQTRMLALLVADITNPFYPQLAKSVEHEAGRAGYTVVICNTGDDVNETRRQLKRLLGQGLDGVIHAAVGRDEDALLSILGDRRRVVFTNRPPASPEVSSVVSDNFGGAAELTRYILGLGHRHIGFIAGPTFAANATERLRGFNEAISSFPGAEGLVLPGDFSKASGELAVRTWLADSRRLTAIIAINDTVALGAMEELVRHGLRLPTGMALAGFDGTDFAASPLMSLTTIDQHSDQMGRRAVRLLVKQLSAPEFTPVSLVLPTSLLIRNSTELSRPTSADRPVSRRTARSTGPATAGMPGARGGARGRGSAPHRAPRDMS